MKHKLFPISIPSEVPDVSSTKKISLEEYEKKIRECDTSMQSIENYSLCNAFQADKTKGIVREYVQELWWLD